MRKQIKKPLTNRAREEILKKLHKYSNGDLDTMVQILNDSIVNCWKDVYDPGSTNKTNRKVNVLNL